MADYKVGDILYEFIVETDAIRPYKAGDFVLEQIFPAENRYVLRNAVDNSTTFHTKELLDTFYRIRVRRYPR